MIPAPNTHLTLAIRTHPGNRRPKNEDFFAAQSYRLEGDGTPVLLALVADGIGGHLAGEIASKMTVEVILSQMLAFRGGDPLPLLHDAILEASRQVSQAARESPEREGMGSTLAAALILGNRLYVANVGDSRIYLLRDGRLRQVTTDHTWVQEAIHYNIITQEEARGHPQSHVLRRHIGGNHLPEPDLRLHLRDGETDAKAVANQGLRLKAGDRLLLCSDGLTDMVEDLEIYRALATKSPEQAADALLNLALERGGEDNITLIIAAPNFPPETPETRSRASWVLTTVISAVALALMALAAFLIGSITGLWPW